MPSMLTGTIFEACVVLVLDFGEMKSFPRGGACIFPQREKLPLLTTDENGMIGGKEGREENGRY